MYMNRNSLAEIYKYVRGKAFSERRCRQME
jgi:hypothetical protein